MTRSIASTIATLPEQLRRSLIWDQGTEMAQHAQLRIETCLPVEERGSERAAAVTSAIHTVRGSAAPTRIPTVSFASTFPKAPTCHGTPAKRSRPLHLRCGNRDTNQSFLAAAADFWNGR